MFEIGFLYVVIRFPDPHSIIDATLFTYSIEIKVVVLMRGRRDIGCTEYTSRSEFAIELTERSNP